MNNTPRFSSRKFEWNGTHGTAEKSNLIEGRMPLVFEVVSERTGVKKTFELDQSAPGYEDGWDGEYWRFTSNEWDGIKLTVINS